MLEIERKFLVDDSTGDVPWTNDSEAVGIRQGYLASGERGVVRVRVAGSRAFLTVKGPTRGVTRSEFEYEVPTDDAEAMLELCSGAVVSKTRYVAEHHGRRWEVDVFDGANRGLVLAEIELDSEDDSFEKPDWLGREVSDLKRYANSSLSLRPYSIWSDAEKNADASESAPGPPRRPSG
jgi:adenylate cyclase